MHLDSAEQIAILLEAAGDLDRGVNVIEVQDQRGRKRTQRPAIQTTCRRAARIVNLSSSSGKRPSATNMAYSVTKAAVLALSQAFADLYAKRGVLVNAIAPGPIVGELWLTRGGLADQQAQARGTTREDILRRGGPHPRRPLDRPEEIASAIPCLCSERLGRCGCGVVGRRRHRAGDHLSHGCLTVV